jgi:SAM-dependent methyltransferase
MHSSCIDFVQQQVDALSLADARVLEVGSLDFNGSVRGMFKNYTGLDIQPGTNVDIVADGHSIPYGDATFDAVLSLNALEHDPAFWLTLSEIKRVLKPRGYVLVSVPGIGFPKHDYPSDYWRFTQDGVRAALAGVGIETTYIADDKKTPGMVLAIGENNANP